jgi:SOS-response transcriptional repressor LexA
MESETNQLPRSESQANKKKQRNPHKPTTAQILAWKVSSPAKELALRIRAHANSEGFAKVPVRQLQKAMNGASFDKVDRACKELRRKGVLEIRNKEKFEASAYRLHQTRSVYVSNKKKKIVPPPTE